MCISGAADQLQSNYAGDFRSILRTVFQMNMSQDEDESHSKEKSIEENDEEEVNPAEESPPIPQTVGDSGTEANRIANRNAEVPSDRYDGKKFVVIV